MYGMVPASRAGSVSVPSTTLMSVGAGTWNPDVRARPKSRIFARPVRVTVMFSGFRSMHDPRGMGVGQTVGNLRAEIKEAFDRQRAAPNFFAQRVPVDQLGDD